MFVCFQRFIHKGCTSRLLSQNFLHGFHISSSIPLGSIWVILLRIYQQYSNFLKSFLAPMYYQDTISQSERPLLKLLDTCGTNPKTDSLPSHCHRSTCVWMSSLVTKRKLPLSHNSLAELYNPVKYWTCKTLKLGSIHFYIESVSINTSPIYLLKNIHTLNGTLINILCSEKTRFVGMFPNIHSQGFKWQDHRYLFIWKLEQGERSKVIISPKLSKLSTHTYCSK